MASGKKKPWSLRLALLLGSTVAALGLAEVGLRAAGFHYRLYPETIEFGYPNPSEMKSDFIPDDRLLWVKRGYREKVQAAVESRPPLVFMGCSCTAWGRYDEALARRVAQRRGGAKLDFCNLAFAGWSSYQGLQQMRTDVTAIAPKVVTIFYGWNDHWIGFGVDDATAGRLNQSILYPLQRLRLVQLVNKILVVRRSRQATGGGPEAGAGEPGRAHVPQRVSPEDFRSNLEQMVDLARGCGATPVLLTAPTSHRQGHEPEYLGRRWLEDIQDLVPLHQKYVGIVREVAAEKGALLCDLAAAVADLPPERRARLFKRDGIHFTKAGDEFVAELLYRFFERQGLLDLLLAGPE